MTGMPNNQRRQNHLQAPEEKSDLPGEVQEMISGLPGEDQEQMTRMMTACFAMVSKSSPEAELAKKIEPEHISAMLAAQEKGMEYNYKEEKNKKIFFVVVLLIVVVAVIGIICLLKENPETMEKILIGLISGALGAAGGYGVGTKKRNDD